jgi:predicted ATPase
LGVSGERAYARAIDLGDAMQLFASRALDSMATCARRRLDAAVGHDLHQRRPFAAAIELTAARTRAFSAQQLQSCSTVDSLVSGDGGRPRRQQTMHAAVDWSYDLLFDDERRLLDRSRCSPVVSPSTPQSGVRRRDLAAADIEVLLARLVDKSLVAAGRRTSRRPLPAVAARRRICGAARRFGRHRRSAPGTPDG